MTSLLGVSLKVEGVFVDDEEQARIQETQQKIDMHRKEKDAAMLNSLETRDRGAQLNHLAADKSGLFARLIHRESFFIARTIGTGEGTNQESA